MRRITRRSFAATPLGALTVAVGAHAGSTEKVTLCHGTASAKNMYVLGRH